MPEDAHLPLVGLLTLIEGLQNSPDNALYTNKSRLKLLKSLTNVLENGDEISSKDADRVLKICLHYKSELQYVPYVFGIISLLINIDKTKPFVPEVNFADSAVALIEFLKQMSGENKLNHMRTMSFQVLTSHPAYALSKLVQEHCSEVIEVFGLYMNSKEQPPEGKMDSLILLKLLDVLPLTEKKLFVKAGIPLWLSSVIPNHIEYLVMSEKHEEFLKYIEDLTEELVLLDYYKYPEFQVLLVYICNIKKIPAILKKMIETGRTSWYRVWIVLIKLLKKYTTVYISPYGTPINLLLPIVEMAFKKDPIQKIRAFACWSVVVENFSLETNENCVAKRVKLLITPLKLNNAKTEDTVAAKFDTWWIFIRKFKPRLDDFSKEILISFLHFLFGKNLANNGNQSNQKPPHLMGQSCESLKNSCLEAFVEIVGHHSTCECSSDIASLNGKVLTTTILVDDWEDWCYSLKNAIELAASIHGPGSNANLKCAWRSLLTMVAAMPDNTVRSDLFNELVKLLTELAKESASDGILMTLLVGDLMLPLFSEGMNQLLVSKSEVHTIVNLVMDQSMDNYYKGFCNEDLMDLLKPIATVLLEESAQNPLYLVSFLDDFPQNDCTLKLWMALLDKFSNWKGERCIQISRNLLKWPLKSLSAYNDIKQPALTWYNYYNMESYRLDAGFNSELAKTLTKLAMGSVASNYFAMFALIAVLKHCQAVEMIQKLEVLTSRMAEYKEYDQLIPPLTDTLGMMLDQVKNPVDENKARMTLNCVKNVLRVLMQKTFTECGDKETSSVMSLLLGNLIKTVTPLYEVDAYSSITTELTNELGLHFQSRDKDKDLTPVITSLKEISAVCTNGIIRIQLLTIITSLKIVENDLKKETIKTPNQSKLRVFASPNANEIKKTRRKEASIVNTVVENGEEYVVVKNNWKFNPKKLTEKQKEKFQKKREIPALYQDLSQSQDEFKLTAWKTDSQDTSLSSNSKSNTSALKNTVSEILKNMPSTDIVPKIIENILTVNDKDDAQLASKGELQTPKRVKETLPKEDKLPTPKGTKSPRMALMDKLYKNVKVLLEKSSPQNDSKNRHESQIPVDNVVTPVSKPLNSINLLNAAIQEDLNQSENNILSTPVTISKSTPITKLKKNKITNSASPPLAADRPTRSKRTPKKFENSQLFGLKKKRHIYTDDSENYSQDDSQQEIVETVTVAEIHTQNHNNHNSDVNKDLSINVNIAGDDVTMAATHNQNNANENFDVNKDKTPQTNTTEHVTVAVENNSNLVTPNTVYIPDDVVALTTEQLMKCELPVKVDKVKSENELHITPLETNINSNVPPEKCTFGTESIRSKGHPLEEDGSNLETSQIGTDKVNEPTPLHEIMENSLKSNSNSNETDINNEKFEMITTRLSKPKKDNNVKSSNIDKVTKNKKNKESQAKITVIRKEIFKNDDTVVTNVNKTKKVKHELCNTNDSSMEKDYNIQVEDHNTSSNIDENGSTENKEIKLCNTTKETKTTGINKDAPIEKNSVGDMPKTAKTSCGTNDIYKSAELSNKSDELKPVKNKDIRNASNEDKEVLINNTTDTQKNKNKEIDLKSSVKKTSKTSRIEKSLMIDTVEGHPLLNAHSEKRLTRKQIEAETNSNRRKSLVEKMNKSKQESTPKTSKKSKGKKLTLTTLDAVTVDDTQDRQSNSSGDSYTEEPCSEDIIESSQDSTLTSVSTKSTKLTPKFQPIVAIEKINVNKISSKQLIEIINISDTENQESRNDIELPHNKTAAVDKNTSELTENMDTEPMCDNIASEIRQLRWINKTASVDKNTSDLTENMDTEPMCDNIASDDVILVTASEPSIITINTETVGPDTQELAAADTQPNPVGYMEVDECEHIHHCEPTERTLTKNNLEANTTDNDITQTLPDAALTLANMDNANELSSPYKDDDQRKQDFLNNTLEISPIKLLSPDREKKSPSPETSKDFVVITLSSPVHSNGEPFEKNGSPEFFSEDKVSPDKRDASPPRAENRICSTSPSSSLSLKKNRPQVRTGGRAAQMLGLLSASDNSRDNYPETESEEGKQASTSTPARRNLRILYNSGGDNNVTDMQCGEDAENFLKLKRALPSVASSPSGPILKRKLAEIEEASMSPASKRKRVSFHDPPVSTTVSVHKYIEPISVRSPQSSLKKRYERLTRSGTKQPKRLENSFNLDSVLSKTIESFSQNETLTDDTQNTSLDVTPAVEIVKTSELNDADPICPDLLDCNHSIDVIATELSSTAMKVSFVKELKGIVETVGDLAKMTELEVNRLCIQAPKIKVAKTVLTEYAAKIAASKLVETVIEEAFSEPLTETLLHTASVETQTENVQISEKEMQTVLPVVVASSQTEGISMADKHIQTNETGRKTTEDIISSCVAEREDFIERLSDKLDNESVQKLAEKLPSEILLDLFMKKADKNKVELSLIRDHLIKRYDTRDVILHCSELLQKLHEKQ